MISLDGDASTSSRWARFTGANAYKFLGSFHMAKQHLDNETLATLATTHS